MVQEIKEVGKRGVIFQYEDQNLVYLIKGDNRLYLCDTHLGPESMAIVKNYINENKLDHKELIIFNSHSDYDHNWGNCAFEDRLIIAQESNLIRFKMKGEYDLEMKSRFQKGKVKLVYPNLFFKEKLYFADDDIKFIHLPGHTLDSAICHDRQDSTVYVGDLVEAPIPIILWQNLKEFTKSLKYLKSLSVNRYIASHSGVVGEKVIEENLKYIQSLMQRKDLKFSEEGINKVHEFNQKNLLMLSFQKRAQEKLKDKFDFKEFKRAFWQELDVSYDDLTNEFNYILETDEEKLNEVFSNYFHQY